MFVVEFLHRVVDTIGDYFGEGNENTIKVEKHRSMLDTFLNRSISHTLRKVTEKSAFKPPFKEK